MNKLNTSKLFAFIIIIAMLFGCSRKNELKNEDYNITHRISGNELQVTFQNIIKDTTYDVKLELYIKVLSTGKEYLVLEKKYDVFEGKTTKKESIILDDELYKQLLIIDESGKHISNFNYIEKVYDSR